MPFSLIAFSVMAALFAASVGYLVFAAGRLIWYGLRCRTGDPIGTRPPLTLLKPICGIDHGLLDNLRSFCNQDYPDFQIIFGVLDENDPALPVIRQVMDEFPDLDTSLVIDDTIVGTNNKVSNLANMYGSARFDIIVISDSDMRVEPYYLDRIASCFTSDNVGVVTCLYSGSPVRGLASMLGAMFVNEWFLPSALLSTSFGASRFCFGATMAVRRHVLNAIGGFEALADNLADDYMLGKLTIEKGFRIKMAPYAVQNIIHEPGLGALFRHELRWARTIRALHPLSHALTFLTDLLVLSVPTAAAAWFHGASPVLVLAFPGVALTLRVFFHFLAHWVMGLDKRATAHLIPLRDLFSFAVRVASFAGRGVDWRGSEFAVRPGGKLAASLTKA